MSLLLLEGFDDGLAEVQARAYSSGSVFLGQTTPDPRTGTGYMSTTNANYGLFHRFLSNAHATFIQGFGFMKPAAATDLCRMYGDSGATHHFTLYTDTGGILHAYRGTAASGTLLGSSSSSVLTNSIWQYVEVEVTLSDTVGVVKVWVGGNLEINLTSQDTKNGGTNTTIDTVALYGLTTYDVHWDDYYVCNGAGSAPHNTALGPLSIITDYPASDGNYANMTPSTGTDHFALVDEPDTPSATDYVGHATATTMDTFNFPDLDTGDTVLGVEVRMFAGKSDTGTKKIRAIHRRASTDSTGDEWTLADSYSYYWQLWEQDPNGTIDWTATNFNASEFGAEVRS